MTLTRARIVNQQLAVETRSNPSDSWERHNFTRLYRRMRSGSWERLTGNVIWIRSNDMYMTRMINDGARRAILFSSINPGNIRVHNADWRPVGDRWEVTVHPPHALNVEAFMSDIYLRQRAAGLELAQRLSVAVAICTGISIAAGFGPLAGAFGLAASGGTGTSVIVGALSGAISTLIHRNYEAMARAVRDDPENGAAHFYRAHSTDFERILTDSLIAGAFGGATALIPAPQGATSLRDCVGVIVNRLGNAFAGVVQGIVGHMVSGDHRTQSEEEIRQGLREGYLRDVVIRIFG